MYESLNCFEEALKHFGTRVEMITAMEMAKKLTPEDAYQMIKMRTLVKLPLTGIRMILSGVFSTVCHKRRFKVC